ncbi:hypothetical protein J4E83_007995 [Alternaria metachromatica]|uniref:uncharacterized protein n=1 Tax=Alternaria metachromatica TaxID=283354 RepID=UPI0020C40A1A|nr:uncharacterized protein J4E83_007995 [Alternaria metachromatica]KAI4611744.1 hypothetical protein J4E83_007995 [Alternaria metachromatica]
MTEPLQQATAFGGTVGKQSLATDQQRSTGARQNIDNPFLTFDDTIPDLKTQRTELEEYVWEFASLAGLKDRYELLRFGARLARDKYEAMRKYADELTDSEKELLEKEKDERTGFWKQSKFLRATIMTASLAGMIQGWTQSANNGTAHGMPEEFNLCYRRDRMEEECPSSDLWTFGMLNAIPLLSAGLFGTLLADPLQENFLGRRGSVMLSCGITIASTIGASLTHNVGSLAACRAINGIALGAKASIVPIYAAEISPEHIRGAVLANWQLADAAESPRYLMKHGKYSKALQAFEQVQTTRLLASRDFMYAHAQLDFESRLLKGETNELGTLADRVDISAPSLSGEPYPPASNRIRFDRPSPQSAVSPGRSTQDPHVEARTLGTTTVPSNDQDQSRPQPEQNETSNIELATLNRTWSDISSLGFDFGVKRTKKNNPYSYNIGVNGYYKRLRELWSNKRCRRALLCASVSMITQTLTGVNTIAFLGTIVWPNSGTNSDRTSAIIGLAFGAANYMFGLPAYWSSDRLGRSVMLLLGLPNMAWSILVFAFLFKITDTSVQIPLVSIFAVIFVAFYAPTAGTSPFSIAAEVFPLVSREAGMAVSVAVNLLGAGVLVLVFPFLQDSIRPTAAFSIFAGLNMVAFVLVYLFVPETRMRTLEELQYTFDLPTGWHVAYRVGYIRQHVWANWWKYLTRKEVQPPVPFYEWARETYREMEGAS